LDVLVIDHNSWEDRLSKDPTITSIANHYSYDHIGLLFSYLSFNCRRFPFDDVRVRRAVAHLMDRGTILKELERGHGSIATCPTKPIYPEYSHDIVPRAFDPELAKKILSEAGWKDSDGDGFLDKDGRMLEFTFVVPSGRTFFVTVTTLLQEACRGVGIRCKSEPKEWSLFIDDFYNRNFDLVCLYASAADPWIDLYEEYHSSQVGPRAGNDPGWKNEEVDQLLAKMREEFDDEKRAEMFHRFNHIYHDEVPKLLLVHGEVAVIQNKRIRGAKIRPTGLQPHDLWIAPEDVRR
jgi:peptide/nickel transport system substrate-binding protein